MNDMLRERLWRSLEALPEERLYQVLDYAEFLSSKYVRDGAARPVSPLRRFSERLEDHMRMNGVGLSAIKGTIGAMGTADRVMSDIAKTGRTLLKEVEDGLRSSGEVRPGAENEAIAPPREREAPPLRTPAPQASATPTDAAASE